MLQIVADPNAPAVVQHCRGGKDRTGFGSMLVLGTLGVKKRRLSRGLSSNRKKSD